jgi:hypothetical protein
LQNISKIVAIDKTNIDFYRMSDAFLIIKKWFEDNNPNKGDFCNNIHYECHYLLQKVLEIKPK